jgi:hypothetical protein
MKVNAKRKSQTRQVIIAGEPRCIYCPGPAATLELVRRRAICVLIVEVPPLRTKDAVEEALKILAAHGCTAEVSARPRIIKTVGEVSR